MVSEGLRRSRGFQRVLEWFEGFRGFKKVPEGFRWFEKVPEGFRWFQRVSEWFEVFRGVHKVQRVRRALLLATCWLSQMLIDQSKLAAPECDREWQDAWAAFEARDRCCVSSGGWQTSLLSDKSVTQKNTQPPLLCWGSLFGGHLHDPRCLKILLKMKCQKDVRLRYVQPNVN